MINKKNISIVLKTLFTLLLIYMTPFAIYGLMLIIGAAIAMP